MVDRHHPGKAPTALLQDLSDGSAKSIADLAECLDLTKRQVSDAASCLLRRDYLMRITNGLYCLTELGKAAATAGEVITSGPKSPPQKEYSSRRNTFRDRAWRAMRVRRRFTLSEILSDADDGKNKDPRNNLGRYLNHLSRAGILRELPRRAEGLKPTSNGFKRWILIVNLGPRAPIVQVDRKVVFDPNAERAYPCA